MTFTELRGPVAPHHIKYRVGRKQGNQYQVHAYIDARYVEQRLSAVDPSWSDEYRDYREADAGTTRKGDQQLRASVECALTLNGTTRVGAGEMVQRADSDMLRKSAYSDALKRAAVTFGLGAYIHDLPQQFVASGAVNYGAISHQALDGLRREYATLVAAASSPSSAVSSVKPDAADGGVNVSSPPEHPTNVAVGRESGGDGITLRQRDYVVQLAISAGVDADDADAKAAKVNAGNYAATVAALEERCGTDLVAQLKTVFAAKEKAGVGNA